MAEFYEECKQNGEEGINLLPNSLVDLPITHHFTSTVLICA